MAGSESAQCGEVPLVPAFRATNSAKSKKNLPPDTSVIYIYMMKVRLFTLALLTRPGIFSPVTTREICTARNTTSAISKCPVVSVTSDQFIALRAPGCR